MIITERKPLNQGQPTNFKKYDLFNVELIAFENSDFDTRFETDKIYPKCFCWMYLQTINIF